jgi:hypothetical protein
LNRETTELALTVDLGAGIDEEELERLARSLRAELLELDVDAVEPAAGDPAPENSRAIEALMVGALIIRLAQTSDALSSLVHTVRGWIGSNGDRSVRLELDGDVLELTGASDDERQRLVDAWIERHARA